MILHLLILAWLAAGGSMGYPPCPGPGACVEPPRPAIACFDRGQPCD